MLELKKRRSNVKENRKKIQSTDLSD